MRSKPTIYIAGPYSKGDNVRNIRRAITISDQLAVRGIYPFIPHLTGCWDFLLPHEYEFWMDYDAVWLLKCDALLRMVGDSVGAEREEKTAAANGMYVFHEKNHRTIANLVRDVGEVLFHGQS